MQKKRRPTFIPLFYISCFSFVFGQTKSNDQYHEWFDGLVGIENTALYNGIGYIEKYKVINDYHKFYKTTDFLPGSIVYDKNYYSGLEMKYDLDEDLIVLNLKHGLRIVLLQPIKKKVMRFTIDNHSFININDSLASAFNILGFHEVLLENSSFQLLEKHQKKRFQRKGKNTVYHEFKSRNFNILHYNNEYFTVKNRKDFTKIFPEFKKQIETYSKKKSFPKSTYRQHLVSLARRIHELLLEQKINSK
ncbi:hypothetical protein [Flagellimonas aquimarina]|uniref:hypothetical protein n=1 Tax=Flagellimonas aquimarina TaxID=2201895 RepID=UPI0010581618|nr:hypothetical protein [Allomuricauda koreensis]